VGTNESLKLSSQEIDRVLNSLGYNNSSRLAKEWRGEAKCHGGRGDHNFSFHYDRGVAQCWSAGCFGKGTDIYGVVEKETGGNFGDAKKYVEEIIGREFDDDFIKERPNSYYDSLMEHIKQNQDQVIEDNKKVRFMSDRMWKIYATKKHQYWSDRGFNQETLDYFGAGYNSENNRITVPIFDLKPDGSSSVVSLKQRIANDDPSEVTGDNPKYLHDSYEAGKVLFNLNNVVEILANPTFHKLLTFKGIILVEGNLDVMMGHQLCQPNIIGSGSNFLTKDQARLLERYTDRLLIIPDEDGHFNDKGIWEWRGGRLIESAKELLGMTMTMYVARLKPSKDLGSLQGEYASQLLADTIRNCWRLR
jgi:hypothetical protein